MQTDLCHPEAQGTITLWDSFNPREKKNDFFFKKWDIIQFLTEPFVCSIFSEHGTLGDPGRVYDIKKWRENTIKLRSEYFLSQGGHLNFVFYGGG